MSFESKKGSKERKKEKNVFAFKVRKGPKKERKKHMLDLKIRKGPKNRKKKTCYL
jgi:hypothetical protein